MIIKILGNPIPLKRHRSCLINGIIMHYDSQASEKNEVIKLINLQTGFYTPKPDAFYKVKIDFKFYFPAYKKKKNLPPINTIPHTTKPDLDNLIKFVLDCGNGTLWQDDKKIIDLICSKSYDDEPSTTITIHEMT